MTSNLNFQNSSNSHLNLMDEILYTEWSSFINKEHCSNSDIEEDENGKTVRRRPGPKSKTVTETLPPNQHQTHSPLKLTFKRLSTCHEPAFKVVRKKKGRVSSSMDEMIQEGRGDSPRLRTPSPTPSEVLRQEVNAETHTSTWESLAYTFGFLAPEPLDPPAGKGSESSGKAASDKNEKAVNGPINGSELPATTDADSGTSSSGELDPPESSLAPPADPKPPTPPSEPQENGISENESEPDTQKDAEAEQESYDSGCEKDESENCADKNREPTPPPPPPTNPSPVGSLTILAPSALNSSVVNGSLPSVPLDSNTVSETFSLMNNESTVGSPLPPPVVPVREGLTVKSPAALGASPGASVNLLNLNPPTSDPMSLIQGYSPSGYMFETCEVCGERGENLDQHRAAMGHYKCHLSPECGVIVFPSVAEMTTHQQVVHGIVPSPGQSLHQLQQQVQRLPVPFGPMQTPHTPPPSGSPGFQRSGPSPITITYPPTSPVPPFQGGIQARPFALQTSPSTMRPDGSPVASPALPPGLSRSISISPSVKPGQKRGPSPPSVETAKRSRPDSPDLEFVDVQQNVPSLPKGISLTVRGSGEPVVVKSKESSGVANILASRGITVTPTVNKTPPPQPSRATITAQPVTTLNLSSAVSIVPASQARSQFAVPQGRGRQSQVTTTVKPPTVDLTQDTPPVFNNRRNRPQRFICQVCDKVFQSQETLNQHLTTHRSPGKLPFKCSLCNAQYPTQQGLTQHKQTYHKEAQGSEMALPIVDMKHPGTVQKLSSLGIRHCLVLSQLVGTNSSGCVFGLPIVAMESARNPAICNLAALGASNVLSLGPAKALR